MSQHTLTSRQRAAQVKRINTRLRKFNRELQRLQAQKGWTDKLAPVLFRHAVSFVGQARSSCAEGYWRNAAHYAFRAVDKIEMLIRDHQQAPLRKKLIKLRDELKLYHDLLAALELAAKWTELENARQDVTSSEQRLRELGYAKVDKPS